MSIEMSDLISKLEGLIRNLRGFVWKETNYDANWINRRKTSKSRKLEWSSNDEPRPKKKNIPSNICWVNKY